MFCVTLQGGLGNQLFQYAFGQMLAQQYGVTVLYDDLNYNSLSIFSIGCALGLYTPRKLELERFQIQLQRPSRSQRFKLGFTGLHTIAEKFFGRKNTHRKHEQKAYVYDPSRLSLEPSQDRSCGGYRNVAKYYEGMQDFLKSKIQLKQESKHLQALSKILQQQHNDGIQTVSIHIRGGDYIKLGMIVCNEEYYKQCLATIEKTIGKEKLHLYIFSDDPNNLPIDISFLDTYNITRIIFDDYYKAQSINQEGYDDVEKFTLMSRCQHHIIANSTYSRWSARLGKNHGMTFAPKIWLKDTDSEQIVPSNWIRI